MLNLDDILVNHRGLVLIFTIALFIIAIVQLISKTARKNDSKSAVIIFKTRIPALTLIFGLMIYALNYEYWGLIIALTGILLFYYYYRKDREVKNEIEKNANPDISGNNNSNSNQANRNLMGVKEFILLLALFVLLGYSIRDEEILLFIAILVGIFYRYVYLPYLKNRQR